MADQGATRSRRGSAASGTWRLVFAFGTGILGVFYLVATTTPVFTGRVEWKATPTDIEQIEAAGFPDAEYLEVAGGRIVFDLARVRLSGPRKERHLFQLTAPVVSDAQLSEWDRSRLAGEPLDLSNLRLIAAFRRDQVEELWPQVLERAEAGKPLTSDPVRMTLTGDSTPAKWQIYRPDFSGVKSKGLDWENARCVRHGVQHHSPFRTLKGLVIGIGLLVVSFLIFRYHRRHPTRASPSGLDLIPGLEDEVDL